MAKPLAIDLFSGLHGWAEGFIAEGYQVLAVDIVDMCAAVGQPRHPDIQLLLQDVLTLHGSQFKDAACIVASPPCQAYSWMAMPWSLAKAKAADIRQSSAKIGQLNALFDACFRIQREASEAAGHYIPMVVENVKGAQPWVGRAKWHYGSFYLWGDVPALMPHTFKGVKVEGLNWSGSDKPGYVAKAFNDTAAARLEWQNPDGRKGFTKRFEDMPMAWLSSKSNARKAASAQIAKIPFALAQYIAQVYHPRVDSPEPARI